MSAIRLSAGLLAFASHHCDRVRRVSGGALLVKATESSTSGGELESRRTAFELGEVSGATANFDQDQPDAPQVSAIRGCAGRAMKRAFDLTLIALYATAAAAQKYKEDDPIPAGATAKVLLIPRIG